MARWKWPVGIVAIMLTVIAGVVSFDEVNRRHPETPASDPQAKSPTGNTDRSVPENSARDAAILPAETVDSPAVSPSGACVDNDGSWKNWSFPNVPMLSPRCK